jgi:hypothetical protein
MRPVSTLRSLVLGAVAFTAAAFAFAAETPKTTAPAAKSSDKPAEKSAAPAADKSALKTEGEKVTLPVFTVNAERLREIDVTIKRLEKQVAREKKQLEKSNLDETLNGEKISKAAALFGGKSTVQRASVAAVRIESMEKELQLLETLRTPLTKADRAMIEQLVEEQRTYRRNLDEALR